MATDGVFGMVGIRRDGGEWKAENFGGDGKVKAGGW